MSRTQLYLSTALYLSLLTSACSTQGRSSVDSMSGEPSLTDMLLDSSDMDQAGAEALDLGLEADQELTLELDAEPSPPPSPEELIESLSERGPHPVGYHTESITYMVEARSEARELKLAWWYPTERDGGELAPYLAGRSNHFAQRDVSPLEGLRDAPVLVFSHGNGGIAEQSYFLTEHFASHGWVVLAVEHKGNTLMDMSEPMFWLFELRPLDVSAALDHLAALPEAHPLAPHVSERDWALSGHSFGGYTTLAVGGGGYAVEDFLGLCEPVPAGQEEACAYTVSSAERYRAGFADPRFKALIPMTPVGASVFGGARGLRELSAPVMVMTAGLDATLPNAVEGDPIWEMISRPDSVRVDFTDAGHFTFSNACEVAQTILADDGCGARFLPYEEAHRLIKLYALAFARQHTLGELTLAPITRGELLPEGAAEHITVSLKE